MTITRSQFALNCTMRVWHPFCGSTMHCGHNSQVLFIILQWCTLKSLLFSAFHCKTGWKYWGTSVATLFAVFFFFFLLSVWFPRKNKIRKTNKGRQHETHQSQEFNLLSFSSYPCIIYCNRYDWKLPYYCYSIITHFLSQSAYYNTQGMVVSFKV